MVEGRLPFHIGGVENGPCVIVRLSTCAEHIEEIQCAHIRVGVKQGEETAKRTLGALLYDRFLHDVALEKGVEFGESSEEIDGSFVFA